LGGGNRWGKKRAGETTKGSAKPGAGVGRVECVLRGKNDHAHLSIVRDYAEKRGGDKREGGGKALAQNVRGRREGDQGTHAVQKAYVNRE